MSKVDIFKKINRNAFNEKLIHRYLFERYYFGNSVQRRKLLPERLHQLKINLIVPEGSKTEARYRADLEVFFKGKNEGVPIEVKWHLSDFKKDNQKNYIKDKNGFVVVLGETEEKIFGGIDVVQIDHEDFADWVADNISRLSRESLIYQAGSNKFSDKTQYWVAFLLGGNNGSAIKHFKKMLVTHSKKYPFWAFKQDPKALPYILDMQRGDKFLFIFAKAPGGNQALQNNPRKKILICRYYFCEIIEPYYMALNEDRGLFFEKDVDEKKRDYINIGDRRWPHFIDFKIGTGRRKYEKDEYLSFGEMGQFAESFSSSFNHGGGTPYPLSRAQFETLKDKLYKIVDESKNNLS